MAFPDGTQDEGNPFILAQRLSKGAEVEEVALRWIELRGGPADGGKLSVPVNGSGDIVVHSLPMKVSAWHDQDGVRHESVETSGLRSTGGAAKYHLAKGEHFATYVENTNPSNESQDWDLPVRSPYLEGDSAGGRA